MIYRNIYPVIKKDTVFNLFNKELINIWEIKGKEIELAKPDGPLGGSQTPELPALIAVMQDAGLEVVSEHGVIVGEVAG